MLSIACPMNGAALNAVMSTATCGWEIGTGIASVSELSITEGSPLDMLGSVRRGSQPRFSALGGSPCAGLSNLPLPARSASL